MGRSGVSRARNGASSTASAPTSSVNEHGLPVEFHLAPGSYNDTAELKNLALDLPEGSVVYGDKAYGQDYVTEDVLAEAGEVTLVGQRKSNSKRPIPAYVSYVLEHFRKRIETAFSAVERMLPKSIHAVTARGSRRRCSCSCSRSASTGSCRAQLGLLSFKPLSKPLRDHSDLIRDLAHATRSGFQEFTGALQAKCTEPLGR